MIRILTLIALLSLTVTVRPHNSEAVISYYCNGNDIYILYGNRCYTAPFTGDEDSVTIEYLMDIIAVAELQDEEDS